MFAKKREIGLLRVPLIPGFPSLRENGLLFHKTIFQPIFRRYCKIDHINYSRLPLIR
jgi:hypothetical protein